jgi:uncharacterized lipoprotein YehR (DUF1307 family)
MRTLISALLAVIVLLAFVSCGGKEEAAAPTGYAPGQTV